MSGEWPDLGESTDRLNSGDGKTQSNYAHSCDSASRDNWVTAALYTGCINKKPSTVPRLSRNETFDS